MVMKMADRNKQITKLVAAGFHTLDTIGKECGITRERVRQIAKANGVSRHNISTPAKPRVGSTRKCVTCGERVSGAMAIHQKGAHNRTKAEAKLTLSDLDLIREFYEYGLGYNAISSVLGVSKHAVVYRVHRMGITPHPYGRYSPITARKLIAELQLRKEQ